MIMIALSKIDPLNKERNLGKRPMFTNRIV